MFLSLALRGGCKAAFGKAAASLGPAVAPNNARIEGRSFARVQRALAGRESTRGTGPPRCGRTRSRVVAARGVFGPRGRERPRRDPTTLVGQMLRRNVSHVSKEGFFRRKNTSGYSSVWNYQTSGRGVNHWLEDDPRRGPRASRSRPRHRLPPRAGGCQRVTRTRCEQSTDFFCSGASHAGQARRDARPAHRARTPQWGEGSNAHPSHGRPANCAARRRASLAPGSFVKWQGGRWRSEVLLPRRGREGRRAQASLTVWGARTLGEGGNVAWPSSGVRFRRSASAGKPLQTALAAQARGDTLSQCPVCGSRGAWAARSNPGFGRSRCGASSRLLRVARELSARRHLPQAKTQSRAASQEAARQARYG